MSTELITALLHATATKPDELLYYFCVKVPQTIILLIFVVQTVASDNESTKLTVENVLDIPLKIVLLLLSTVVVFISMFLWPCIRFVVARKPVTLWCHKVGVSRCDRNRCNITAHFLQRVFKRLQKLHKRIASHRRSESAPEMTGVV
jgi:hypothetical protein